MTEVKGEERWRGFIGCKDGFGKSFEGFVKLVC